MWAFLVAIVPLVLMIFQEFFSMAAKAKEEQRVFEVNQANLKLVVDSAVNKWNSNNSKDSQGAGSAWDAIDQDIGKKK